ncbi:MAG TPA: alpha/beta hydrolase [Rhizomicrobium sp.]|jgi:pimeloyl-ACP methyl ester carboxylesterase|nr:alpha/beta hydrolase [Rhizomicrobium sp.]
MPQIAANGITLEYVSYGPENAETVLLIMGLGAQMTRWPLPFIQQIVAKGYRVVTFDNRDVGLSTKFDAAGPADVTAVMAARMAGQPVATAYTLEDMANDAAGLLDALKIERAHIVGASMGGMIAQLVAANHPDKTLSLVSIMSSTGNPALPPAKPEAMAVLMSRPDGSDFKAMVEHAVKSQQVIGSLGYPADAAALKRQAIADLNRSTYPVGVSRQMAAIMANGDRRAALKKIAAPTIVVHGADDPLVPVEAGRDTAAAIAGAELREIPGMGHDLPAALYGVMVDAIDAAAKRAHATA